MKLSQLLVPLGLTCPQEADITDLTCDSRTVTPGALFVALEGVNGDGHDYIPQAEAQGAAAIVCSRPAATSLPTVVVPRPRQALALLAGAFYHHPAKNMSLIAVTGTKGKTTTAHMIRDILLAAGYLPGMIGTLGAYVGREKLCPLGNTTPEPTLLHQLLRTMADRGCTHVVMEVSSQAMKLDRVAGLTFEAGLFLNLTPDHIGPGEHKNYEEYTACKAALFAQCALGVGNGDDMAWPRMAAQLPPGAPAITFGFGPGCQVRGGGVTPERRGVAPATRFTVSHSPAPFSIPLPGAYHAADALAALALCRQLGVEEDAIRAGLAQVTVPGRAQRFPGSGDVPVIIDYAHNAASFRAILGALGDYEHGRIIVVFGAGGNRPPMRRYDMAQAAAELADYAIVTTDNPRWEPVEEICTQITRALGSQIPWEVVYDRRQAIFRALELAQPGDMVALLGKGHEDYIEVKGERHPFSEWKVLEEYFQAHPTKK